MAYELDAAAGIPVEAKGPTPEQVRANERANWIKTGAPFPYFGPGLPPPNWEEQRWLDAYKRAGCEIRCDHGGINYYMPGKCADEGVELLCWLGAAEDRVPGISYRVHSQALRFEHIKAALNRFQLGGKPRAKASA